MRLNLKDIFEIPGAEIFDPDKFKPVANVSIDSRSIRKNSLFVAIKGEKFDGHKFVNDAIRNGATAIVVNKNRLRYLDEVDVPIIAVKDTSKAYGDIANIWRNKLNATVISITGSNGKTSTKDYLTTLLGKRYNVVSTKQNNNNHIGVPLTIFEADEKTEILILEHGTNHFGEIEYTAKIAQPDIALITNIGDGHLEFLIDRNGVLKEKGKLFEITAERNGVLVINDNDSLLKKYSKNFSCKKVKYAFNKNADVRGKISGYDKYGRPIMEISDSKSNITSVLPVLGRANAKNILAAVTVAKQIGLNKREIIAGIKALTPPKGRLNLIEKNGFIIIDDTYNSNPNSLKEAVEVLKKIKIYKKKVLILGDMFELGKDSKNIHRSLAPEIKKLNKTNTEVYTIGKSMRYLNSEIKDSVKSKQFNNRKSLQNFLMKMDVKDRVILVKGSRGMHMEEYVNVLGEKN